MSEPTVTNPNGDPETGAVDAGENAAPVESSVPASASENPPRTYVTTRGTTLTVTDGKTVAVDADGSQRTVDGDVFETAVNVATLLNL